MIQFNLLPDVKLEYIRARRAQRLVFAIATIVTSVSVAILLVIVTVGLAEKKHLSDVNNDIASESSQLQKKPQIDKILTVQSQLQSLGQLHDTKLATSRLFSYLNSVTPVEASITNFTIDFVGYKASITGTTDSLSSVNKYVDTLKFTKYNLYTHNQGKPDTVTTKPAFSNVVLSSFAVGDSNAADPTKSKTTFNITLIYDPPIFDITQRVTLVVPVQATTRSAVEGPTNLFAAPSPPSNPSNSPSSPSSPPISSPAGTGGVR